MQTISREYYTNLYTLIKQSSVTEIREKITNGTIDKNYKDRSGLTMLHYSVSLKKSCIFNLLINEMKVDMTIKGRDGKTAFYIACQKGYIFFVKLFTNKPERDFVNIGDLNGTLPIDIAFHNKHIPIVKYLLQGFVVNDSILSQLVEYEREERHRKIEQRYRLRNIIRIRERMEERERMEAFLRENERIRTNIVNDIFESERREELDIEKNEDKENKKDKINSYAVTSYIEMLVETKKECSICLEPFETDKTTLLKCWHAVCLSCNEHIDKCPICRENI